MTTTTLRSVTNIVPAQRTVEGAGFVVHRPFPTEALETLDPFLMIDEMGPVDYAPGEAVGAPDHPHRGFETISYILEGEVEHEDSAGFSGKLSAGSVQWMTAGSGVVHSEMPSRAIRERGGRVHGFQIWVNLPRRLKMTAPRYQDVHRIPEATSEDGKVKVRVVAGSALGASAVIETHVPITYLHFTIAPGGRVVQPIDATHAAGAYVFRGAGTVGGAAIEARRLAVLDASGDAVELAVPSDASEPMEVLLLSGAPIREPVAWYGPFVMNAPGEIKQAILDYQSGRMGSIKPETRIVE
ncbi:pirin family protein [Sandaracinus amylolyticus]|uniref:pirin family protein n=1 Tax=Sandaracinus amylolyticus TaxID=927083 RepID=UPI001F382535|nr:pirin family protein [Sandaracinus amylolyticus]UJR86437.1 Hypothetical protein I5071_85320 [Sandaracinus amylolyticus]